jgi:hypothetical protein
MKKSEDINNAAAELIRELIASGYRDIPAWLLDLSQPPPGATLTSLVQIGPRECAFELSSVPQREEAKS